MEVRDFIIYQTVGNLYWKDLNGRYLGCNKAFADDLGLSSPSEIIGKNDYEIAHKNLRKEEIDKIVEIDREVMRTGQERLIEEVSVNKFGEKAYFVSKKVPLRDDKAKIIGVLGTSIDITLQKVAEEHQKRMVSQLLDIKSFVINQSVGNLYWKDLEGRYLGCNLAYAKVCGLSYPEEIVGKSDYDLHLNTLGEEKLKLIVNLDREVMTSGLEKTVEEIGINANKEISYYITRKVPLKNQNGEIIGLVGTSIDITAQKEAEKREQAALIKATEARARAEMEETLRNTIMVFADAIAHNQRTPLAIINCVADIFEKIHEKLMHVYEEAKLLQLKTITELKEKERLYITEKKGIDALHRAVKTMSENIDSNLQSLHVALKARTGTLTPEDLTHCYIDDNLKLIESNDAIQMQETELVHVDRHYNFDYLGSPLLTDQIFDNLTRNALYQIRKHQKGEIFVTTEDGGAMNLVRFRDTAGGAPPEVVSHLFDTHFTTKAEGNGVGLAFCKTTMQLFGGDITCHSVHGDYIEFVLSFPKLLA